MRYINVHMFNIPLQCVYWWGRLNLAVAINNMTVCFPFKLSSQKVKLIIYGSTISTNLGGACPLTFLPLSSIWKLDSVLETPDRHGFNYLDKLSMNTWTCLQELSKQLCFFYKRFQHGLIYIGLLSRALTALRERRSGLQMPWTQCDVFRTSGFKTALNQRGYLHI